MATNHTTNYQLNLWEPGDSFLREEFNQNSQKLDAALGELAARTTYVPLLDITTSTQANQVDLDVSRIDFTAWRKVILTYEQESEPKYNDIVVRLNGNSNAVYCSYNASNGSNPSSELFTGEFFSVTGCYLETPGYRTITIEFQPIEPCGIYAAMDAVTIYSTSEPFSWHRCNHNGRFTLAVGFDTLKTVNFVGTIGKNTRFKLWGVN